MDREFGREELVDGLYPRSGVTILNPAPMHAHPDDHFRDGLHNTLFKELDEHDDSMGKGICAAVAVKKNQHLVDGSRGIYACVLMKASGRKRSGKDGGKTEENNCMMDDFSKHRNKEALLDIIIELSKVSRR